MITLDKLAELCRDPMRARGLQQALAGDPDGDKVLVDVLARDSSAGGVDPWQVRTLADARQPRLPLQHVVSGIAHPSVGAAFGSPGVFKSWLTADCCMCVALGIPWLAPLPNQPGEGMPVMQAPTMWLDFDNGRRRTDERFEALANAYHAPDDTPFFYYSMPSPWLDAGSADAMGDLTERVVSRGVKLVVIDNLGLIHGKADENSADMIPVMSNLRELSERTDATVIVIHHQRKSSGYAGRSGEQLRGHSGIEAALDLALWVEREESSDLVTVRSTKSRDGGMKPFGARFTYRLKADGKELSEARFHGVPIEDTNDDSAIEAIILDVVKGNRPINQTNLKNLVKNQLTNVGINRVCVLANGLVERGLLRSTSGKRGARDYDLP